MAQGQQHSIVNVTPELWKEWCAAAGYAVTENGAALIGVSGDSGDGYIVEVVAPTRIDGTNLARALLSHALRIGQAKIKASKEPSRTVAIEAANSAVNGAYTPARKTENDIIESEVSTRFANHVKARVLAVKADATQDVIDATVKKQADTEAGKRLLAEFRTAVLKDGTYTVSRKGKGGSAVEISL